MLRGFIMNKSIMQVLALVIGVFLFANIVSAGTDFTVNYVKLDGDELSETSSNPINVEAGEQFDVKVSFISHIKDDDVEVQAFLSGYRYNDKERISDWSEPFDVKDGVEYKKTLKLTMPDRIDEDQYKLRVIVSGRSTQEEVLNFILDVDRPSNSVVLRDVYFSPADSVQAGRALLTTVRVRNLGENDEDSVKITVSMPDFGISATDYIDEVEYDDSVTSEELYMRIPLCAKEGYYDVEVDVEFDDGYDSIPTWHGQIFVQKDESCTQGGTGQPSQQPDQPLVRTIITAPAPDFVLEVVPGGAAAVYPFTITNKDYADQAYTVTVNAPDDLQVEITPTTLPLVKAGAQKTFYVYVKAASDATLGKKLFAVNIMQGEDTLRSISNQVDVVGSATGITLTEGTTEGWYKIRKGLEIGALVLLALLLVVGVIMLFNRMRGSTEEQELKEYESKNLNDQTYY